MKICIQLQVKTIMQANKKILNLAKNHHSKSN